MDDVKDIYFLDCHQILTICQFVYVYKYMTRVSFGNCEYPLDVQTACGQVMVLLSKSSQFQTANFSRGKNFRSGYNE